MRIIISSGHGKYIRGASGYLDEVDEARRVVDRVADCLRNLDTEVVTFHDDVSTTQDENLNRIVDFHNSQTRDLDVSVHFNAHETTTKPMGTEVLYITQDALASELSAAIAAELELPNRGGKERNDLFFLNQTEAPAILIETCFVDSSVDAQSYRSSFDELCVTIAEVLADQEIEDRPPISGRPPSGLHVFDAGKCSWFGGPNDMGVDPDEDLAFIYEVEDAPHLFLPEQPQNTTGLARRLDPHIFYIACRWDYDITPREMLANPFLKAKVTAPGTGRSFLAWPADWGPHEDTGRIADISPGLMEALGITTDDQIEVTYPAPME